MSSSSQRLLVIVLNETRGMMDVDSEPVEELLDLFDNLCISDPPGGTVEKVEVSCKRKRRQRGGITVTSVHGGCNEDSRESTGTKTGSTGSTKIYEDCGVRSI
jgi:hypothetical protein